MRGVLQSRRALLSVPSPAVTDMIRHDPLALFDLVREELGAAQAGVNFGVIEGGYVSADYRSRLLVAKPEKPPFDAGFSRELLSRLEALRARPIIQGGDADAGAGDEPTIARGCSVRGRSQDRGRDRIRHPPREHRQHRRLARVDPPALVPGLQIAVARRRRIDSLRAVAADCPGGARARRRHALGGGHCLERDAVWTRRGRRRPALRRIHAGARRRRRSAGGDRWSRRPRLEHAPRNVDDGRDVLRARVRGLSEPRTTRHARRPQHGALRPADARPRCRVPPGTPFPSGGAIAVDAAIRRLGHATRGADSRVRGGRHRAPGGGSNAPSHQSDARSLAIRDAWRRTGAADRADVRNSRRRLRRARERSQPERSARRERTPADRHLPALSPACLFRRRPLSFLRKAPRPIANAASRARRRPRQCPPPSRMPGVPKGFDQDRSRHSASGSR